MKNFVVVRIANKPDGTTAVPVVTLDTEVQGRKEYFRQCGLAVDSENLTDAVIMLNKEGMCYCSECFVHPAPEPEPEPEPEPTPDPEPDTDSE